MPTKESSRFDTKETTGGWSDSKEGTGGGWSDFKQMYEDFSRTYKLYKEWKVSDVQGVILIYTHYKH